MDDKAKMKVHHGAQSVIYSAVSDPRRNLEALFCPRLKVNARKFGELNPLKLLPVSELHCLVS